MITKESINTDIKVLAFLIALKRYRKNSVVFKKPNYIMCSIFGIAPQSFKKYLKIATSLGYIKNEKNVYRIIKFKDILLDMFEGSHSYFKFHNVINGDDDLDLKKIILFLEECLVVNNVYSRQSRSINIKSKFLGKQSNEYRFNPNRNGTVNKEQQNLSRIYRDRLPKKSVRRKFSLKDFKKSDYLFNNEVMTSCRNVSNSIGFSKNKANRILNRGQMFKREQIYIKVKGCTSNNVLLLESLFKNNGFVNPKPLKDVVIVHFGSKISLTEKGIILNNNVKDISKEKNNIKSYNEVSKSLIHETMKKHFSVNDYTCVFYDPSFNKDKRNVETELKKPHIISGNYVRPSGKAKFRPIKHE